jgi:hypothetical protein
MGNSLIDQAIEFLEKANADLEPELLSGEAARSLLEAYARAEKLARSGSRSSRASSMTRRTSHA